MKSFTAEFQANIKSIKNQNKTEITLVVPTYQLAKYLYDLSCLAGSESVIGVSLVQESQQLELPEADEQILERWPVVRFATRMKEIRTEEEGNKLLRLIDAKFATLQTSVGLTSGVGQINKDLYVPIGDLTDGQVSKFIDQIRSNSPELAEMAEDLIRDREEAVNLFQKFVESEEDKLEEAEEEVGAEA